MAIEIIKTALFFFIMPIVSPKPAMKNTSIKIVVKLNCILSSDSYKIVLII